MVNVAKLSTPTKTACVDCSVKDTTPPGTPEVRVAAASAKLFGAEANFQPTWSPAAPGPAPRDPAYLEIGNWEPGTQIQVLNKTNSPTSTFENKKDVVTLDPTGRDLEARVASVWMTQKEMDKIDLDAGDSIWIRLVDSDGNASEPVKTRLQGNGYGQLGNVLDEGAWHPASRMPLLDGEAEWKQNMVLRHIGDQKAPQVKAFESKLKLEKGEGGEITLTGHGLLEEGAQVRVQLGSGSEYSGSVDTEQQLSFGLGALKNGENLFVTVTDVNGQAAGKFEIRYGDKCKDGKAPTKGILGARLAGVIKPGV